MKFVVRAAILVGVVLASPIPWARAQPLPPKPEPTAKLELPPQPTIPPISEMLDQTPETQGVFEALADGSARHVQSGMVCQRKFGDLAVWRFQSYPSPAGPGTDVACDYGIQGLNDMWACKLTLFAVKAKADETADTAFLRYKAEVEGSYPQLKFLGPAITFKGDVPEKFRDLRSAEYEILNNDVRYQSDLVVLVRGGWILEIRGTVRMDIVSDEAAALGSCLGGPSLALLATADSVGTAK